MPQILALLIVLLKTLSSIVDANNLNSDKVYLEDLDLSIVVKRQIQDGFTIKKSINTFKQHNRNAGSFATVGNENDDDCDYRIGSTKIQDAIDLGETEIRIASNDTYNTNIVIDDKSIILKGGYNDCAAAIADNQSDKTNLSNDGDVIIKIIGSSQRNTVILDSLTLLNGKGAIFTEDADLQLNLLNMILAQNVADLGGGIRVSGGDTDVELENTLVISNEGINGGGGIYCDGSDSTLIMHGDSGIYANKATNVNEVAPGVEFGANGGGISINGGCSFLNYSGGTGGFLDFRGFINNTAAGQGGGIAISTGSIVTLFGHQVCVNEECLGNNSEPVNLLNNLSGFDSTVSLDGGGAAYVNGSGSALNIYAGLVSGNESLNSAGAIQLNSSTFTTKRLTKACWSQDHCNYYEGNKGRFGGVISATSSVVEISDAIIENNRAFSGTVLSTGGSNGTVIVNNSVIHHNGNYGLDGYEDRTVMTNGGTNSLINIYHSTIVDNNVTQAVFFSSINSSGNSKFTSSIVHDSISIPINADISLHKAFDSECSIVHEDDSIIDQSFTAVVADPGFVDRANRDYHIDPNTSLAVDYCFENNTSTVDIDFDTRGYDDPSVNDNLGVFDIGADETIINDIIFQNGFDLN